MPPGSTSRDAGGPRPTGGAFATTRWTVVLGASGSDTTHARAALEELCRVYWRPIYAYVRRQGHAAHDAQDLTQEFFSRLLQKDYLRSAAKEKGRLRTFLAVALKRFLANEWDRVRAQKRGGGQTPVAFDAVTAEQRYQREAADTSSPDRIYERQWAMTLLAQAMARLRAEYRAAGKEADFEALKGSLTAERGAIPYAELAQATTSSEATVRVSVHRLRKRFREVFRATIADTVDDVSEVEDELRYVARLLGEA